MATYHDFPQKRRATNTAGLTATTSEEACGGRTRANAWRRVAAATALLALALATWRLGAAGAQSPSARGIPPRAAPSFDLRNAVIPRNEIYAGGPPKDGIPALTNPAVVRAHEAAYLNPADRVVGLSIGEEARAYPLRILSHHEIVNDRLGDVPVAVTYCPLCDSAAAFDRRVDGEVLELGVSGLLYNSNVLMFDRGGEPESLWSQLAGRGVSGPAAGNVLKPLPLELTTWRDWQARHPNTTVLSDRTGHTRDYRANPYQRYFATRELWFPARPLSDRLPTKAPVLGVWSNGAARAYPLSAFNPRGETLEQELGGKRFTLAYDGRHQSVRVESADEGIHWMYSFWFAWHAFRPQTEVYGARR